MRELVRTNDAVLISAIEALLKGAHIGHMVVDQNMSVLEGSIGIFPRRILVDEDELENAQQLLEDAGFAHEIRRDGR
jgi:Putative prokaryotic signal transducing protein